MRYLFVYICLISLLLSAGCSYNRPIPLSGNEMTNYWQGARYPIGRIIMNNGMLIEGKRLVMSVDSVSISVNQVTKTYQLSEISQVMVKKDLARKCGLGCGSGCAALWSLSYLTFRNDPGYGYNTNKSDLILNAALWTGISYGLGYLICYAVDDWTLLYQSIPDASNANK